MLSRTLDSSGHNTLTIDNPLAAYEVIEEEEPDLVILDLMVSYLTCFEIISKLRSQPGKYIKIVIMTQVNMDSVIAKAFELGVDDYILLPLRRKEFLARLERLSRYDVNMIA